MGPDGKANVDRKAVLDTRDVSLKIDISKPFKLNAGTFGVCASSEHDVFVTTLISFSQIGWHIHPSDLPGLEKMR